MSNRLTFSLASLVLILMFGFVAMPVMAHDPVSDGAATDPDDTLGHPDALKTLPTHEHPTVKVSATDADPNTAKVTEIVQLADRDSDPLTLDFQVTITLSESVVEAPAAGLTGPVSTTAVTAGTFEVTDNAVEVLDYDDSFDSVGTIELGIPIGTAATNPPAAIAAFTQADAAKKPLEWTLSFRLDIDDDGVSGTTPAQQVTAAFAAGIKFDVKVPANIIQSSKVAGPTLKQGNEMVTTTFTAIASAETLTPEKVAVTVGGTPSVSEQFEVTFTIDKADQTLDLKDDIVVTGGELQRLGKNDNPPTGKTVYNAIFVPILNARTVSVTIKKASTKFKPAEGDMGKIEKSIGEAVITDISPVPADPDGEANDQKDFEVYFTFDRVLPNPLMLEHLSIGTMAGDTDATNDMMDGNEANDTVTDATDPMFLSTPSRVPGETMKWRVTVSPKKTANTIVGLSAAGMKKFSYGSGVKALTVKKEADTPTGGTVTAAYDDDKMTTTISVGAIAGNKFAVIDHMGLPDLELFFDIGGTITLHDADATKNDGNVRSVVMSEILWGLDTGESPVGDDQEKHQFIELYNTTADSINLKGWTLVFTPGNVRPPIDIDQVSNRGPDGWLLANGPGKSGRIAGTTADPTTDSLLAPSRIISMYRKIGYDKVEKVKDDKPDPNRDEQLKGIPGGNAVGSWANSVRPSQHRWILSTKGEQHHKTIGLLEASKVAGKPFVISEFGNDTGGDNDWIELHNLDTTARSLENVQVSMVTAKGTDTELFDFVGNKDNPDTVDDKEWTVPPGGYIVISTRHPRDTDLATGKDISTPDSEQVNKGLKHLYAVKPGWNLQDDGKFALILRNTHDKLGTGGNGNLVDVVATRSGAFADTNTSLWPLVLGGNPHGNVIDGGDENFGAGKVYQRNDVKNNGRGDKSLAVASYTGIGYDVKASKITANHGTPGYAKDAAQATKAGIGADVVTISEIMYDVGDAALRRKLPQWIELHNASLTLGVNLKGWKLHLENAAQANGDLETNTFSATVTIGDKFILPNQTIIVASSTGNVRDPNHFPATRVINLWTNKTHRDALEMTHPTDPVLSTRGFSITLVDKDGEEIDMVGNLDGNRRTRDEPAWALPAYDADDRSRSSILRVYAQKVALDGKMADSWKLASDTVLAFEVSHAYYGSSDDIGSPGYRLGDPLPVSLSKFRPERQDDGTIAIRWITESELNNAGFNILRSETRNGEFKQINTKLIAGHGTTSERSTYTYTDPSAKPNVVYYYQIQDVSLDGKVTTLRQTRLKGHISAAGKLTTTWGELKALQ